MEMKTLLIPVDFSATSENALKYAAEFCKDRGVERIILLKSYYISLYAQLLPTADFVQLSADDIRNERQKIQQKLKETGEKLIKKCNPSITVETVISDLPLLRAVHELIEEEHPGLLLMGSDNITYLDETYIGDQVITIAKTSTVPVLLVPDGVRYKKIKQALLPCDFAAISRLGLLKVFHSTQKWPHPELMVLNVDQKQKHLVHGNEPTDSLKKLLENYQYKVYYSADKNIVNGILSFAKTYEVQLIISLPGKNSFFYNLTHRSITDALALNTHHPVLILK
jgi:nucleotide-binding universal stress UspA family protein